MQSSTIIRALVAAALVAAPSFASAAPDQNSNPNTWSNQAPGQYGTSHHARNRDRGRDRDDRRNDRDDRDGNRWNGERGNGHAYGVRNDRDDRRDRDDDDADSRYGGSGYGRNGYGRNGYGYGGGYNRPELQGVVSSFSPYNLYLSNGVHVELHDGTVINPTGINLTGGQRVRITGTWNGDRTFSANEIDVVR